jgi:hypothetical protein
MGRGLNLLVATAFAAALAMPFLVLLSLFFFGMTSALIYLFVAWLGGEAILTVITGFLLRTEATIGASVRPTKVVGESQEASRFSNVQAEVFSEAS